MAPTLTINVYLRFLAPDLWNDDNWEYAPIWPADTFAIVSSLLIRSGAYSGIGTKYWNNTDDNWEVEASNTAKEWRENLTEAIHQCTFPGGSSASDFSSEESFIQEIRSNFSTANVVNNPIIPPVVREWWAVLVEHCDTPLHSIENKGGSLQCLGSIVCCL